jgi:hypothetical protein
MDYTGIRLRALAKGVERSGPDECWEWTKGTSMGYGRVYVSELFSPYWTHRLAWEAAFGPVPDGLCVLHKCDNRRCCNPNHLFLGTRCDNMKDMAAKGRARNRYTKSHA